MPLDVMMQSTSGPTSNSEIFYLMVMIPSRSIRNLHMIEIKRRERDAVLQSLQAGLVPRLGLHLIQVGRKREVEAILADLDRIEQGGAAFRIVVGRFGSGKSFFLNLVRTLALQKRMVVVQADMSMERAPCLRR